MKPINFVRGLMIYCAVLTCAYRSKAEPGYGPFFPAERVRSVLLVAGLEKSSADETTDRFVVSMTQMDRAQASLWRHPAGKGADLHLVVGNDGKDVAFPVATEGAPVLVGVYSALLNADDTPDFIATLSYRGCGLWADLIQVIFLLSDGAGGYVMQSHETLDWDVNDIVDINGDGRVGWIQTELEQVSDHDRQYHSFWVHKLWRIEKTSMTEDIRFKPRRRAFKVF